MRWTSAILALTGVLAACGGGGGSSPSSAQRTYAYVTPKQNSQRVYAVTDVDNSSNTINLISQQTVTGVNPDGTFLVSIVDPTNTSITVNGTTYSITPGLWTEDATGHDLMVTFSPTGGASYTCTYTPHGLGPDFPLAIGETWQLTYTYSCHGGAAIIFTQNGKVADAEMVTVPAGTFSAVKLQSTVTWTTPSGTMVTESITRWLDANSGQGVKETAQFSQSGTVPVNGYLVSQTVVLQTAN